jgi:cytochrome c553
MQLKTIAILIAGLGLSTTCLAEEGKSLYENYGCAQCHGADAKNTNKKGMRELAGFDLDDIYYRTRKFIEGRSHEQVVGNCGEPPSPKQIKQIKQIAEYLSKLPK